MIKTSFERLDKTIASQTDLSRKQVQRLAKSGALTVNAKTVFNTSTKVDTVNDSIAIHGKEIDVKKHLYIMMNKPKGVLSAARDKKAKTVVDLVPSELKRKNLFPAGRLDKDTTGFILITNDGDFAHRVLSPKNQIEKTYEALLLKEITQADVKAFENGIVMRDNTCFLPAELIPLGDKRVFIKIREGKYHQVKRMFKVRDNEVLELKRTAIGALALDNSLESGECRELDEREIDLMLKKTL